MSTHDTKGRPWATHADVKEGTVVETDGGFTCLNRGVHKVVKADGKGRLFIDCAVGGHYLDGQCDYKDGDPVYIGLYNVTKEKAENEKAVVDRFISRVPVERS